MAEGRMLKKKISLNEAVADLADDTHRLLFTWGIAHLDVEGRITGNLRSFKGLVAPLLDHITPQVVLAFFQDAEHLGLIRRYQVDGRWVVQYPAFKKNQTLRPDKEAKSQYPPPNDFDPGPEKARSGELPDDSGTSPGGRPEYSGNDPGEIIPSAEQVREGEPEEGLGQGELEANAEGSSGFRTEDNKLQQQDITGNNSSHGVDRSSCSGTTPGVVREDSGRTPDEVKLREVKGREENIQASACVIGGADDPPATSPSSRLKPSGLMKLWNDLGCQPTVSELTEDRRKRAGLRLRKQGDPDWWRRLFEKAKVLNKAWLTFDFLMKNDTNSLKVLEGNYDRDFDNRCNGRGARPGAPGPRTPRGYDQRRDQYVVEVPDPD
jgi:hypothetical protein